MLKKLTLSLIVFGISGCSKVIDSTSPETFETSVAEIMDSLEGDKRVQLHDAIEYLTEVHDSPGAQKILDKVDAAEAIAISDCYKNRAGFSQIREVEKAIEIVKELMTEKQQLYQEIETVMEPLKAEKKVADESARVANQFKATGELANCTYVDDFQYGFVKGCTFDFNFHNKTNVYVEKVKADILLEVPGEQPLSTGTFGQTVELEPGSARRVRTVYSRDVLNNRLEAYPDRFGRIKTSIVRTRLYGKDGSVIADSGMFSGEKSSRLQKLQDGVSRLEADIKEGEQILVRSEAKIAEIQEDSLRYQLQYKERISQLGTRCYKDGAI